MELIDLQRQEVETLAAVLSSEQIADYFGIGRTTFYDLMRRDAEIAVRYKRGKAKAIGAIAQGLINKARSGDTTSMIFFLKTQGGWRETDRSAPSVSIADALEALSDAELEARLSELVITLRQQGYNIAGDPQALPVPQVLP
jgi:hypothetical protein